jgi:transcriptional regulator with XRE-family HTH domain
VRDVADAVADNRGRDAGLQRTLRRLDEADVLGAAARAGISAETLRKIETGRAPTPAFFTVAAVARALGLSMDEIAAHVPCCPSPAGLVSVYTESRPRSSRNVLVTRRVLATAPIRPGDGGRM